MCCITKITPETSVSAKGEHYKITVNRVPKWSDYIVHKFQVLEYIEKICEVADETFHLISFTLKAYMSEGIYSRLNDLHHSTHEIEHTLHAFCFFNDIARIITGKFIVYRAADEEGFFDFKEMDCLRTAARVSHTLSHFLYSVNYLEEMGVSKVEVLNHFYRYIPYFSAAGYLLWSISLVWNRRIHHHHFTSDLLIQTTGFMFEAIPLCKSMSIIKNYTNAASKVTSLAGIIHAWLILQVIGPKEVEKFKVPQEKFLATT